MVASDEKVCPRCAETIKAAAKVCRYCGHEFDGSAAPSEPVTKPFSVEINGKKTSLDKKTSLAREASSKGGKIRGSCAALVVIIIALAIIGSLTGTNSTNKEAAAAESSQIVAPNPDVTKATGAAPPRDRKHDPVTKAFAECLSSQAQSGSYSSFDGGTSAINLMGACKAQWDAWEDQCIADGGTDGGPGGCTMQAGLLAQAAIKLVGK